MENNTEKQAHFAYDNDAMKTMIPCEQPHRIGITPGAVVGAITGGLLASKSTKKKIEKENMAQKAKELRNRPKIEGNYYSQVQNVSENLDVVMTPMSVVYTLKNKGSVFTLDTIETSEMNEDMLHAWSHKDKAYFKSLMMAKMHSSMQIAEQMFTKRFLERQADIKAYITKEASDDGYGDLSEHELLMEGIRNKVAYEKTEYKDKLTELITNSMEKNCSEYNIELTLDRPFDKYAGFVSGIKSSLGLSTPGQSANELKRKLGNPSYVKRNLKVGYLPDRVVFAVDGTLVSTLELPSMNEQGYANFGAQNTKYFKDLFVNGCKQGMSKMASEDNSVEISHESDSEVNEYDLNNIFHLSDIHPVVYYLALTKKFGVDWIKLDTAILQQTIEKSFGLTESISDIAFNKIMAIHTANQSMNVYQNSFCFEKIILSLTDKPVDFFERDHSQLNIDDIVYSIDVLDRVTPFDDIYDNFSEEVFDYIASVLTDKQLYAYNPINILSSPMEPAFNDLLNEYLVKRMKSISTKDVVSPKESTDIEDKIDYISNTSLSVLKTFRRHMVENHLSMNLGDKSKIIESLMMKIDVKPDCAVIIKDQVITNLAVDDILSLKEAALVKQLELYGLNSLGGDVVE